jgi:hypothetical protein
VIIATNTKADRSWGFDNSLMVPTRQRYTRIDLSI